MEYGDDGSLALVVQRRFMKDDKFVLSGVGDDTAYTQGAVKMPANYNNGSVDDVTKMPDTYQFSRQDPKVRCRLTRRQPDTDLRCL